MAYRGRVLAVAAALLLAACGTGSPGSTSTTSADYQNGYAVGLKAYVYGLPLMVTDATYQAMTSIDVSQGAFGPVNQFNNMRSPNGSGSTAVVAPGATSLSSIAWVDLTGEPQVLHVPEVTDHFFVLALLDPYTENIVNLGSASSTPEGNYVLVDPAHRGVTIPQGAKELDVDYARIWIIGSTQLKGASDIPAVNKIQDGYTLTPLSRFGTTWTPSVPANPITTVLQRPIPTGVQFFDQLGADLQAFPPPNADAPLLVNVSRLEGQGRSMQWSSDLIGYDALTSYGSPSYHAQQMFSTQHGDEILATDHEYGAVIKTWDYYCERTGAKYIAQPISMPVTTAEDFVEQFWAGVTERTKVIMLSHITSGSALIFPLDEICRRARAAGIITAIDGAHAPSQIDLNLDGHLDLAQDFAEGGFTRAVGVLKQSEEFRIRRG